MEKIAVSDLKQGQFYKLDMESFWRHPYLQEIGYGIDGYGVDPRTRFKNDLFMRTNEGLMSVRDLGMFLGIPARREKQLQFFAEIVPEPLLGDRFLVLTRGENDITGWDPEIFVTHADGRLIPAFKFLPSKHEPSPIHSAPVDNRPGLVVKSGAYWDGFQAEFSTIPGTCHEYGFDRIREGLKTVLYQARKTFPDAQLTIKNVFTIPEPEMLGYSEEFVALGCDMSLNAYRTNPFQIDNPFQLPYRMAGGHVHLGFKKGPPEMEVADMWAKYMDLLVALPAVGMFAEIDDPIRRQFYGRAGEYRLPPHGMEYRTLSNAWLGHPAVGHVLMDFIRKATGNIQKLFKLSDLGLNDNYIRDVINNTDVKAARTIVAENFGLWKALHKQIYRFETDNSEKIFKRMVMDGVESVLPNFRDVQANWCLGSNDYWEARSNRSGTGTWRSLVSALKG